MNILLAGGTGNIGKALTAALLERNHAVFVLTRKDNIESNNGVAYVTWDGLQVPNIDFQINAVINLCGDSIVAEEWTDERKLVLHNSRVIPTQAILAFINRLDVKPEVLINASAVGFYGNRDFDLLTEDSELGSGYLAELSSEWEAAAHNSGIRTVFIRTGIVLEKDAGALPEALKTFALGFGGYFGNGQQGFPWIHIADEVGIIVHCLDHTSIEGPINLTAPELVSYKQFIEIASKIKHKFVFPAPELALRIILGKRADMLLSSQYVYPKKATESGYSFVFPKLKEALENLL